MTFEQNLLRQKVLTPLTMALVLVMVVFSGWILMSENEARQHAQTDLSEKINHNFKMSLSRGLMTMHFKLDQIGEREDIVNAFLRRDRASLLALTKPLFDDLKAEHKITHLSFLGPDRVNFLRVHQPKRHGDTVNHVTILEAEKIRDSFFGLEIGSFGTFTQRYVKPIFEQAELLGYVELGMEIEHLLPHITDNTNAKSSIILHKVGVDRKSWERGMKSLDRRADWDRYKSAVVIYESSWVGPDLSSLVDEAIDLGHTEHTRIDKDGEVFNISFVPIMDAVNREVGDLVVINDISDIVASSHLKVLTAIASCISIAALYLIWLYPFLGRVQSRIEKSQLDMLEKDKIIRQNEKKLSNIIASSPAVTYTAAAGGDYAATYISPNVKDLMGLDPEDFLSAPAFWADHIHPDDVDRIFDERSNLFVHEKCTHDYRFRKPDGSYMWVRDDMKLIFDDESKPKEIIGSWSDITNHKMLEHSIQEHIKEINCLFQLSELLVARELTFEKSLPHIAEMVVQAWQYPDIAAMRISYGDQTYATDNFQETPWRMTCEIRIHKEISGLIEIVYLEEKPKEFQGPFTREERSLLDEITVRIGQKLEALRDDTEHANMEQELQQALKLEAVGQLAGGIAHEINTPTQFIGDNLRFLEEACADVSGVIKSYEKLAVAARTAGVLEAEITAVEQAADTADLDYIKDEIGQAITQSLGGTEQISRIVLSMKEFAHPSTKEKSAIDINKSLETTITVSRNEWKYAADMETDFAADLPMVPGLPGELNQVFLNLVVNAAHAIQDKIDATGGDMGRITIRTYQDNDWVKVCIKDTGSGIPKDIYDKIFEQFFTTKEVGKGTGQGLSISYDIIVNKHHGNISFESEEGQGTTFVICLPISNSEDGAEMVK
ncbi:MAG: hypothetical protein COB59_09380 [Rhodospirillaceae bacterium]|nr:MAG: hypothetical protein COB59_09380 [Rhodospirillaceae bacterium]